MIPFPPPEPPRSGRHALPRLAVEVTGDHLLTVIRPSGEVDLETAELFAAHGMRALAGRPRRLVVNLSETTFFSVAGLRVLDQLRRAAEADAVDFQVRAPSAIVRIVLDAASHRLQFLVEGKGGETRDGSAAATPGFDDASASDAAGRRAIGST